MSARKATASSWPPTRAVRRKVVLGHQHLPVAIPAKWQADVSAQRLPVDLRIAACRRVAVPHIVKVNLRQTG